MQSEQSVPFFLADYALPPVGIESEFGRLLLEEGLPGLLLWVGFIGYVLWVSLSGLRRGDARTTGMWIFCAGSWGTGLIGTGLLAAIPSTMLLMLYCGELIGDARPLRGVDLKRQLALESSRPSSRLRALD